MFSCFKNKQPGGRLGGPWDVLPENPTAQEPQPGHLLRPAKQVESLVQPTSSVSLPDSGIKAFQGPESPLAPRQPSALMPTTSQTAPEAAPAVNTTHTPGKIKLNRCPFGHGTVGVGPYPGYVHGRHPAICKHGCLPDATVGRDGRQGETWKETLVREALEFQDLYHKEKANSKEMKEARVKEILREIQSTGTYWHTQDELQHGARVAWRNAPKCSNRKFAMELRLFDKRSAATPAEMFKGCLELLEAATESCVTTTNILVFRPQTPGQEDGPRVWNNQLLRFAGYDDACYKGEVLGDPAEKGFTRMLRDVLGWQPPEEKERTQFDMLPLVLQSDPTQPPEVFNIPPHYVQRVRITHPEYPQLASLGLQWYAIPAVSNLDLSVGGITYTACPFNGWYACTEIVRNLTDESRYNLSLPIAKLLGFNTKGEETMWRDKVVAEVTVAVMHSFKEAGMGMVNHHTLIRNFYTWYNRELETRGYCPGNWKWIIPPISPTASKAYLELNKMTEYTLKPGYWYGAGWKGHLKKLRELSPSGAIPTSPARVRATPTTTPSRRGPDFGVPNTKMAIIYATVSGNTQSHAERVAAVMSAGAQVQLLNMEEFEADSWADAIKKARFLLVMSSTYGPGATPGTAIKFLAWCEKQDGKDLLKGKHFSMLGFGSSCYPRFCAAADTIHNVLLAAGAIALTPVHKADATGFEELVVWDCVRELMGSTTDSSLISEDDAAAITDKIPVSKSGQMSQGFKPHFVLVNLGQPEGLMIPQDHTRVATRVKQCVELLKPAAQGSEKRRATRLIKLDIDVPGQEVVYEPGDSVSIWGQNPPHIVEDFARKAGISNLDDMFILQDLDMVMAHESQNRTPRYPLPNTFRNVLSQYVALSSPLSFEAMSALLQYLPTNAKLQQYAADFAQFKDWCDEVGARFCDIYDLFPGLLDTLPLAAFLQMCPNIKPRHYSIASSQNATKTELHLTVGRLFYNLPTGAAREGFCSAFLTNVQQGDLVHLKILPTPGFRMPLDLTVPVILVAAGTGIAPFKGFWEERRARAQALGMKGVLGPCVMLFGCRSPNMDHIFRDQLVQAMEQGVLSSVLVAYSREATETRMYVQELLVMHSRQLLPLLTHDKCHVYVCGSSKMAQGVAAAFEDVMTAHAYNKMVNEGRYHEGAFGIQADPNAAKKLENKVLTDVLNHQPEGLWEVKSVPDMNALGPVHKFIPEFQTPPKQRLTEGGEVRVKPRRGPSALCISRVNDASTSASLHAPQATTTNALFNDDDDEEEDGPMQAIQATPVAPRQLFTEPQANTSTRSPYVPASKTIPFLGSKEQETAASNSHSHLGSNPGVHLQNGLSESGAMERLGVGFDSRQASSSGGIGRRGTSTLTGLHNAPEKQSSQTILATRQGSSQLSANGAVTQITDTQASDANGNNNNNNRRQGQMDMLTSNGVGMGRRIGPAGPMGSGRQGTVSSEGRQPAAGLTSGKLDSKSVYSSPAGRSSPSSSTSRPVPGSASDHGSGSILGAARGGNNFSDRSSPSPLGDRQAAVGQAAKSDASKSPSQQARSYRRDRM